MAIGNVGGARRLNKKITNVLTHLHCALGKADVGHGIEGALGLGAGDALQRAQRLVQLHRASLQRRQQLIALLSIQLV